LPLVAVDGLRIRHFDDATVVFHPLSWDAHLLNPAAFAVLELLLQAPHSESEIIEFLEDALRDEDRPQAVAHSEKLISELRSLGLIRQTADSAIDANRRDP